VVSFIPARQIVKEKEGEERREKGKGRERREKKKSKEKEQVLSTQPPKAGDATDH